MRVSTLPRWLPTVRRIEGVGNKVKVPSINPNAYFVVDRTLACYVALGQRALVRTSRVSIQVASGSHVKDLD